MTETLPSGPPGPAALEWGRPPHSPRWAPKATRRRSACAGPPWSPGREGTGRDGGRRVSGPGRGLCLKQSCHPPARRVLSTFPIPSQGHSQTPGILETANSRVGHPVSGRLRQVSVLGTASHMGAREHAGVTGAPCSSLWHPFRDAQVCQSSQRADPIEAELPQVNYIAINPT